MHNNTIMYTDNQLGRDATAELHYNNIPKKKTKTNNVCSTSSSSFSSCSSSQPCAKDKPPKMMLWWRWWWWWWRCLCRVYKRPLPARDEKRRDIIFLRLAINPPTRFVCPPRWSSSLRVRVSARAFPIDIAFCFAAADAAASYYGWGRERFSWMCDGRWEERGKNTHAARAHTRRRCTNVYITRNLSLP